MSLQRSTRGSALAGLRGRLLELNGLDVCMYACMRVCMYVCMYVNTVTITIYVIRLSCTTKASPMLCFSHGSFQRACLFTRSPQSEARFGPSCRFQKLKPKARPALVLTCACCNLLRENSRFQNVSQGCSNMASGFPTRFPSCWLLRQNQNRLPKERRRTPTRQTQCQPLELETHIFFRYIFFNLSQLI